MQSKKEFASRVVRKKRVIQWNIVHEWSKATSVVLTKNYVPYARKMTTSWIDHLLKNELVKYSRPLFCPIHAFILFLDELVKEKDILEVSLG